MPDAIWDVVVQRLASEDPFDRTAALARAVGSIETALTAVGIPNPKAPVTARLKTELQSPPAVPLLAALNARNEAIHALRVPGRAECGVYEQELFTLWTRLKRKYVNKQTAASIGHKIAMDTSCTVFIYGSLARGGTDQNDIDFLLLDNGELSYFLESRYEHGPQEHIEVVFDFAEIGTPENRAAATLGWLQFIVLDGRRFGSDLAYMQRLVRLQHDPFFFLNMAPDLQRYDLKSRKWSTENVPVVFTRLAILRRHLENEGLLVPHRKKRKRRSG
jgi:hypothetical protein